MRCALVTLGGGERDIGPLAAVHVLPPHPRRRRPAGSTANAQQPAPTLAAPTRPDPPRPAPAALAAPAAAPAPVTAGASAQLPALPSRPYAPPDKLSTRGKEIYAKIKPILDGPPEAVPNTITETEFCIEVDGDRRRVDTRVVYAMSDFMREAVTLAPVATGEALKRLLALRMFLKHPDAFLFASAHLSPSRPPLANLYMLARTSAPGARAQCAGNILRCQNTRPYADWCSIMGAIMTSDAAKARLTAIRAVLDALPPGTPPPPQLALPEALEAMMSMARADANAFLTMGLQCLQEAEAQGATNGKPPPPPEALHGMRARVATVLAYILRHLCALAPSRNHACVRAGSVGGCV